MAQRLTLHADRLFPADPGLRDIARRLYATVRDLPIVSPHGHTDPQWFADDAPFADASALFITPDHYVFRMLYSQGVPLEELGIPRRDGAAGRARRAQDLAHSSPSTTTCSAARRRAMWLDHAFARCLRHRRAARSAETADAIFDRINAAWQRRSSGRGRCSSASTSR